LNVDNLTHSEIHNQNMLRSSVSSNSHSPHHTHTYTWTDVAVSTPPACVIMRRLHYDGSIEVHTRPITRPRDTYNMTQEFSRLLLLRKQDLKLQTDISVHYVSHSQPTL